MVLRAHIVLAAAQGSSNAQIARDLHVNIDTVRLWRDRWAGWQGIDLETLSVSKRLQDASRPGVAPTFTLLATLPNGDAGLRSPSESGTPHQPVDGQRDRRRNEGAWDRDPDFTPTCGSVAQKGGLQPHHLRYWLTKVPDEQREEKIVEGCQVYASAPERAKQGERTLSMDELTGVQALERKHPDLPMQPDHVLRREFEYIRHGTLSWFINFDVVTGRVIEPSWGPTRTEEDALAHLQRLIANDPEATKWHIMLDNLNIPRIAQRDSVAQRTLAVRIS